MMGNDGEDYEERLKRRYPELYADESFQEMRNKLTVLYNMMPEEKFAEVLGDVDKIIKEHLKKAGIEDKEYE